MRWDHGEAHRTSKILVMFQFLSQVDISMGILITLLNCTYIFCMLVYTNIIKSFKFCFLYHLLGIFLLPGNTQSKSTYLRTWVKGVVLGSCLATDSNAHTHNPYLSPSCFQPFLGIFYTPSRSWSLLHCCGPQNEHPELNTRLHMWPDTVKNSSLWLPEILGTVKSAFATIPY